jgi:hypothetical protein
MALGAGQDRVVSGWCLDVYGAYPGWIARVVDEETLIYWTGSAWQNFTSAVTSLQNLSRLGIGATADATNPFSDRLDNAL